MQTKITFQDIPTNKLYEGYLWWSDQETPDVYIKQELKSQKSKPIWPSLTDNPFIIEGNLWQIESKISYLIRFVDGEYLIYSFSFDKIPDDQKTELEYIPNRFPEEIEKLKFKEIWLPKNDTLCDGFEVLKPAFIAFVGFKYEEEKK